jgi:hypothetical protein
VSQADAYLARAPPDFLAGDHIQICKFTDDTKGHDRFRSVWMALKRLSNADPTREGLPLLDRW